MVSIFFCNLSVQIFFLDNHLKMFPLKSAQFLKLPFIGIIDIL